MSDGKVCSLCLRGHCQLCTTDACAHGHRRSEPKPATTERLPVRAKQSTGTSDRRLLERSYEALTTLRRFSHPNVWDEGMTELYGDIEERLNKERSGTIQSPRALLCEEE